MSRWRESLKERFLTPVRAQLLKGADSRGLAITCAMGVSLGAFPLIGTTTVLCLIAGLALGLNQPVLQTVNYLMAPVQLALIPVFGFAGMHLGSPLNVDPNPATIVAEFLKSPSGFLVVYGELGLRAVAVWGVTAPIGGFVVYRLCLSTFRRLENRLPVSS